jgi:hypothetical protein
MNEPSDTSYDESVTVALTDLDELSSAQLDPAANRVEPPVSPLACWGSFFGVSIGGMP